MNGIYEISNLGDWTPAKRAYGCVILDVNTQALARNYNHPAVAVTTEPSLAPSPAINLDGSDMVRMSWPEADDVIGWIIDKAWRVERDYEIAFDESTPSPGRIEWAEHATQFAPRHPGISIPVTTQDLYGITPSTTIPDVIG